MSTRTIAVVSAGLSAPSSTRLLADRLTAATVAALADRGITATVEVIRGDQVEEYYDRVVDGDVRYRAVIDVSSLD